MPSRSPGEALRALRSWTARSADPLAAAASVLIDSLGLEPAPETTASARLTARTIRFYSSEGVLSPPAGQTRRAVYGYRHLLELLWIKEAQARGRPLEDIRLELEAGRRQGEAVLEETLLGRLPARAARPLPSSPEELDQAVSWRFSQGLRRAAQGSHTGWTLGSAASPPAVQALLMPVMRETASLYH